jgi:hypothetical protein
MNAWKLQLKKDIEAKASEARRIRVEIQALRWKEGSADEVRALRGKRDERGRTVAGRRALAPFRRPETGPERAELWAQKRGVGVAARTMLLLRGMLSGVPYARIEARCREGNAPSARALHRALAAYLVEPALAGFPEAAVRGWLEGVEAPRLGQTA